METAVAETKTRRVRSWSQLSGYLQCSWAFYLGRILKLPEAPAVYLAGGTAFHTVTENFDRHWYEQPNTIGHGQNLMDETALPEYWQVAFNDEFDVDLDERRAIEPDESKWRTAGKPTIARPTGEDIGWWRRKGQEMVAKYIAHRVETEGRLQIATIGGEPAIELKLETELGGVPVVAYVDRVEQDRQTGVLLIKDMKTGSRVSTDPGQVGLYSVMLGQAHDVNVTWGSYYDARRGVAGDPIDLTLHTEAVLGRQFAYLDHQVDAGVFEPNVTPLCKACGLRKFCKAQGGEIPPDTKKEV